MLISDDEQETVGEWNTDRVAETAMTDYNCDTKESIDPNDEISEIAHERWIAYTNGDLEIDPTDEIKIAAQQALDAKHSDHQSLDEITIQLGNDQYQ